ncbi:MAG: hypothetical protein KTR13_04380 [Saprospiraceae bacterium]|nr:hypothetical protein [Saprospiraceae bacterium]
MVQKINWKNFWVDMLGILLGITIAFQLQSWKERQGDRKLTKQYLQGMTTDLEDDIAKLNYLADTTRYSFRQSMKLNNNLIRGNYEGDSIFMQVMSLFEVNEFLPTKTSYESLVNSGDLTLIKDFDLRQDITRVYSTIYDEVEFYDNTHTGLFGTIIYPYINKEISFTGSTRFGDNSFLATNEFVNLSFANRYSLYNQLVSYEKALKATTDLKAKIDSTLQR